MSTALAVVQKPLQIQMLPVDGVRPSGFNPRKTFAAVDELAANIKLHGIKVPLRVRPIAKTEHMGAHYELVFGERTVGLGFPSNASKPRSTTMEQKPSIGRIVHYQSHGSPDGQHKSEPRAAVITAVVKDDGEGDGLLVSLCVLNPTGMYFDPQVPFSETPKPGCWRWPPRV